MSKRFLSKKTANNLINEHSTCAVCGVSQNLTVDHIIPIKILVDMGYTVEETYEMADNLRILCRPCNVQKKDHLDFSGNWKERTVQLFIKYAK